MSGGRIVDAIIKTIIDKTDGLRYQFNFGNEQTALVRASQVVHERWREIVPTQTGKHHRRPF
jgi:hypothetical protein